MQIRCTRLYILESRVHAVAPANDAWECWGSCESALDEATIKHRAQNIFAVENAFYVWKPHSACALFSAECTHSAYMSKCHCRLRPRRKHKAANLHTGAETRKGSHCSITFRKNPPPAAGAAINSAALSRKYCQNRENYCKRSHLTRHLLIHVTSRGSSAFCHSWCALIYCLILR